MKWTLLLLVNFNTNTKLGHTRASSIKMCVLNVCSLCVRDSVAEDAVLMHVAVAQANTLL
jgi:hypothetical protein